MDEESKSGLDSASLAAGRQKRSESTAVTSLMLRLARKQHGVFSRKQLLEHGLSPGSIDRRLASRRISVVFPGVYGMGPGLTGGMGRCMAATMSCGGRVALSHRSAARVWGLIDDFRRIELISGSMRKSRVYAYVDRGLIVHQTRSLPDEDLKWHKGIPVTSVGRTIVDCASVSSPRRVEALFNEADRKRILDLADLDRILDQSRGRPGVGLVRRLAIRRDSRNQLTDSEMESIFLSLCVENSLPLPAVNSQVLEFRVDCCWPDLRFIIELDSVGYHADRATLVKDRRRDAKLQLAGFLVLRLTHLDLTESPGASLETVRAHLRRAQELRRLAGSLPAETSYTNEFGER